MISIIVPVYKVEAYLKKCLDSILNQTYRDLEVILVDDGSPDKCPALCDEYAKRDVRVKVIHQNNMGLSAARNAGIKAAQGEYIGFVDSDDYIASDMYEEMLKLITNEGADLVICNVQKVDEANRVLVADMGVETSLYNRKEIFQRLNEQNAVYYITAWNKLYRRELFDSIVFPVGKIHEDEFIVHEIFNQCNKIVSTNKVYYFYMQREGSIMSSEKSIKNLDSVEAFYNRALFYAQDKELQKYTIHEARRMWEVYNIVSDISVHNIADKKRVKKMMKSAFYMAPKKQFTCSDWIKYVAPGMAVLLRKIVRKLRCT